MVSCVLSRQAKGAFRAEKCDLHSMTLKFSASHSPFAFPEADRAKHDAAVGTSLERKPWPEFVFFIDNGDILVLVRITVTIDADSNRSEFVFDKQIDPLIEFHL